MWKPPHWEPQGAWGTLQIILGRKGAGMLMRPAPRTALDGVSEEDSESRLHKGTWKLPWRGIEAFYSPAGTEPVSGGITTTEEVNTGV